MSQAVESVSNFIVTERRQPVVRSRLVGDSLDPQLGLLEEGIIDSLGLQQIITFIEQQFNITIDDDT